ncbi:MAG: hypothetical protein Q8Q24_01830 [bacterium]|nr:hypothetical protein [bacterium]
MKLFFGELKANYEKYLFPYQVWLLKEEGDSIEKIYDSGFLPIRNLPNVYYLSRNIRVDLSKFSISSENRRILGKTSEFSCRFIPLGEFNYTPVVQKFCKDYMDNRFGKGALSATGIKNIFQKGVYNKLFVWTDKTGAEIGFAVCFESEDILQYAHSFYDVSLVEKSLGARMILEAVIWAKDNGKKYIHLGTCYETRALYKTEFLGVEFFNGFTWSNNLKELKFLIETPKDKSLLYNNEFLDEFYSPDLVGILNNYGICVKF